VQVAPRSRAPHYRLNRVVVMNLDTFMQTVLMTSRDDSVALVKAKIHVKFGIPPEHQQLLLRTCELVGGSVRDYT
jgi:hypothetical protein